MSKNSISEHPSCSPYMLFQPSIPFALLLSIRSLSICRMVADCAHLCLCLINLQFSLVCTDSMVFQTSRACYKAHFYCIFDSCIAVLRYDNSRAKFFFIYNPNENKTSWHFFTKIRRRQMHRCISSFQPSLPCIGSF